VNRLLYRSCIWVLLLQFLVGCAANAPTEADRAELENRLVQFYGASGVAFTPDGRRVAVGTRDRIWVADTSSLETTASLSYVQAARFGAKKSLHFIDDRRLVVGAEGSILIWDTNDHSIADRYSLPATFSSPRAITWSENRQTLAFSTGARAGSVYLVEVDEKGFSPVRVLPGITGVPADLQFSSDGRYLAAAGDGQGVIFLELETGEIAGELPTEGFVNELELFGDNRLLVAGADIAFWTFLSGEDAFELENPDFPGQVGGQVATRVAGGIVLGALTIFTAAIEALGGGSGKAATDMAIATYDVASDPVKKAQQPWCGRSTSVSPDGAWLVDVYPGITKEIIRVIELESGKIARHLNPRGEYSCAVKFSPDGRQLLITTDKVAQLYDTKTWKSRTLRLGTSR